MPIPVPGTDPGPQYAFDLNSCLSILDQHDHTVGLGNPITPSAMLINADLPMGSNNMINLRSTRFNAQSSPLALPADVGATYVSGVDLWYNDVSGNQIQITALGGVAGTPGSIANLVSPASASYVSGTKTFVWQSNVNQAANMDAASYILRNIPGTFGLTLSPPSLGSNYTITLPTLPGSPSFMTIDSSGNIGDAIPLSQGLTGSNIANATITGSNIAATTITETNMAPLSVGTPELIDLNVTPQKLSAPNTISGSSTGVITTNSTSELVLTTASLTVSGIRPVLVTIGAGTGTGFVAITDSINPPVATIILHRDGPGSISVQQIATTLIGTTIQYPFSMSFIDFPPSGNAIYKLDVFVGSSTTNLTVSNLFISALEI